eukprot:scaffold59465_cov58-Cyclotella_meneghiniana.AAC.1
MSVNTNLPLALASPSSGHRPCNHLALSLLVSAGLIRRQKRARASEATDDGEHAADINEQWSNPIQPDVLATTVDLGLNLEDVDVDDLADLFSNQERGPDFIVLMC